MNHKQRRFVDEYLITGNATGAAERAGYSDTSYGRQLLTKPHVRFAIREGQKTLSEKAGVTAERVIEEYARIGFASMGDFTSWGSDGAALVPSSGLSDELKAVVSEISETPTEFGSRVRIKLHDKIRALDALSRLLGLNERPIRLEGLPKIESARDASKVMARITEAVATGEITPEQGERFARIIEGYCNALDTKELQERIEEIFQEHEQ